MSVTFLNKSKNMDARFFFWGTRRQKKAKIYLWDVRMGFRRELIT